MIFPWRPREGAVARLICDVVNPDGSPYECCSRSVLKRVVAEIESEGYRPMVGAESEFYLFHVDEKDKPTTAAHDFAGFCDVSPIDLGENARRDMVLTLEEMGIEISSSHHEFAPGQNEISLKSDDALTMSDKLVTFRFVARTIARRHGLYASFMPKPVNKYNGSALHIYQAFFREFDNVFYDPEGETLLSETVLYYIGGLIRHAHSFAAITNPIINSYKRLVPGAISPGYVAWSSESRNAVVRIHSERGDDTMVEMSNPDSACNPYLAIAVMLKAGLEGVKNKTVPPAAVSDNLYCLTPQERMERGIYQMPRNLFEAVQLMKQDRLVTETVGEILAQKYIEAKETEWAGFESHVHQWELDKYLPIY